MATWTPPATTFAADEILSGSAMNGIAQDTLFLYQPGYGEFYNNIGASVAYGAWTKVLMTNTSFNNYGVTFLDGNAVIPLDGVYQVSFRVAFLASTPSGGAGSALYQNGDAQIWGSSITDLSTDPRRQSNGSGVLQCDAGDHLTLYCWQATGIAGSHLGIQQEAIHSAIDLTFYGSV